MLGEDTSYRSTVSKYMQNILKLLPIMAVGSGMSFLVSLFR